MPTKTKKAAVAEAPPEDSTAPPEPIWTIEAPARELAEKVNTTIAQPELRSAALAAFNALDDGGNKPTTVTVELYAGRLCTVAVSQGPE